MVNNLTTSIFKRLTLKDMLVSAMFSSLIIVLSFLRIPLPFSPVPITGQSFGVILTGLVLPPVQAFIAVGVYILLGLIGLPVFSGGTSGIGVLLGPTGGYLVGFLFGVIIISLIQNTKNITINKIIKINNNSSEFASNIIDKNEQSRLDYNNSINGGSRLDYNNSINGGSILAYSFVKMVIAGMVGGIIVVYIVGVFWLSQVKGLNIVKAFSIGALPYLIGDIFKLAVAVFVAQRVSTGIKLLNSTNNYRL